MGPGLRQGCFKVRKSDGELFAEIHPDCVADSTDGKTHIVTVTGTEKMSQTPSTKYGKTHIGTVTGTEKLCKTPSTNAQKHSYEIGASKITTATPKYSPCQTQDGTKTKRIFCKEQKSKKPTLEESTNQEGRYVL